MDNIDFNIDLINFINQEKKEKKINGKKIFGYFNSCLIKTFVELNTKFINIENKNDHIISAINMIYYIYFLLITYTNNIKLTIFLLERSILLFSEFIIMSQDKKVIDEICFIPNSIDALSFAYKKTIGPLKLNDIIKSKKNNYIKDISYILKNIYQQQFLNNNNNITKKLNEINIIFEIALFNLFEKSNISSHNLIFNNIKNLIIHYDVNYNIYRLKLFLDITNMYIDTTEFNKNKFIERLTTIYNCITNLEYNLEIISLVISSLLVISCVPSIIISGSTIGIKLHF